MKRFTSSALFIVLLLVVLVPSSWAQASFGVKAGLNVADLKDLEELGSVEAVTTESKTGFIGGAYLNFPLGPFKLQVEGLYSVKGAVGDFNLGVKASETKLTYIEVPLFLKYEFPIPAVKPFFYGGGSMAFLMTAEQDILGGEVEWTDIKDDMESVDYGLVVGGGIELFTISLDVRYTYGLSNTVDTAGIDNGVTQAKNRTFSVMAGIKFF